MSDKIVSRPLDEEGRKTWDRIYGGKRMDNLTCESCGLRLPDVEPRKDRHGNEMLLCAECFGETTED